MTFLVHFLGCNPASQGAIGGAQLLECYSEIKQYARELSGTVSRTIFQSFTQVVKSFIRSVPGQIVFPPLQVNTTMTHHSHLPDKLLTKIFFGKKTNNLLDRNTFQSYIFSENNENSIILKE
jgi:hypothetical protein